MPSRADLAAIAEIDRWLDRNPIAQVVAEEDSVRRLPFAHRCFHYEGRKRCTRDAVGLLHGPDGQAVPGGYACQEHAVAGMREYLEKLGETWTLVPLVVGPQAQPAPFEPPTPGSYVPPPPDEGPCCDGECSCNGESYPRWGR